MLSKSYLSKDFYYKTRDLLPQKKNFFKILRCKKKKILGVIECRQQQVQNCDIR